MERRSPALFLAGEAAAVIAALRSNLKFNRYTEDELEDQLLEDFKSLRRKLFSWQSWEDVNPLEYLIPFLETVKSPETSGPITLVALTSLHKIIIRGILGTSPSTAEAIQAVADGVTQCKFEATYPASDECVLYKILDVLVGCVGCPAGSLLTNDNLINIFQACYRIGHFQTEKGRDTSELLTQASRQAMAEMVHQIFSRLDVIPEPLDSPFSPLAQAASVALHTAPRLQLSPMASPLNAGSVRGADEEDEVVGESTGAAEEVEEGSQPGFTTSQFDASAPAAAAAAAEAAGGSNGAGPGSAEAAAAAGGELPPGNNGEDAGVEGLPGAAPATPGEELPPLSSPQAGEIVSLLPSIQANTSEHEGYGVEAVREVLLFIISLIASAPVGAHQDLPAHGLDLMSTALQAAGPALEQHDSLMVLLQQDLVRAMFAAAKQPSLASLAGICQVSLGLYVNLGASMLLQVEALLSLLLLPLAEGKGQPAGAGGQSSQELQQVALEGVLDFCNQPGFVRDVYLNLDCRIERTNLFEQLCALLSKTAFPVSGPLAAVHLQSLDGILAILTALSSTCKGISDLDAAHMAPLADPSSYVDIWTALSAGNFPPLSQMLGREGSPAELARLEKFLKGRLAAAADHFNRDQKKGFQYLQSLKLLPPSLEPGAVARFLRCCPGLAKPGIGEVLGERDAFYEGVRTAFMETFDFTGMDFDLALRMFMDSFRPPGEGQKIDRIMQVFGTRYYQQMPSMGLLSSDAAYVLAFSVIMLNTDLHNTQNKKKMSMDDFARINRNTNEGEPMPRDLLETIYASISRDELKISSESSADELPAVFWYQLAYEARRPRGRMLTGATTNEALERDMFGLIWGPTLAAVSVVLDNANDANVVQRALDCLLLAARMAAYHQVDEVVDSIVAALSKFAVVLHPPKGAVAYGESHKARAALETMFAIANRYGDWLRSGWRNVMDCVLRLHRLELLPPGVITSDGEDPEDARQRMPRPASFNKIKGSSGSLFSRAITSLISIEGSDAVSAEQAALRETEAVRLAGASVEVCQVEEIFGDSKFLTGESLVDLVKAVMWAAGNVAAAARTGDNTASAELCLELLITLALRNRDRVGLIWPLLHEFLAACTSADNADSVNPLVERAVVGLLRICQRLLPYKEDTAETLLRSLKLVVGLHGDVVWKLSERIATELLVLLKSSAPYVRSEADWHTVCTIIKLTAERPSTAPVAYECLNVVCSNPRALSADSYMPLLEACLYLAERHKERSVEASIRLLDLIELLFNWLATQSQQGQAAAKAAAKAAAAAGGEGGGGVCDEAVLSDEALVELWLATVNKLAQGMCKDSCQPLRDNAIMVLSRALTSSEQLNLPPEIWVQTLRELLVPVVTDLVKLAGPKSRTHQGAEKSVRLAVAMLVKHVLQYIEVVCEDPEFYSLWHAVLTSLQECMVLRHEAVQESVPEQAKNILLVLGSSGILTRDWKDKSGRNLWDLTFSKVHTISSGLNPSMVEASLSPRRPSTDGTPGAAGASGAGGSNPGGVGGVTRGSSSGGGGGGTPVSLPGSAPLSEQLRGSSSSEIAEAAFSGVRSHPISPEPSDAQSSDAPGAAPGGTAPAAAAAASQQQQGAAEAAAAVVEIAEAGATFIPPAAAAADQDTAAAAAAAAVVAAAEAEAPSVPAPAESSASVAVAVAAEEAATADTAASTGDAGTAAAAEAGAGAEEAAPAAADQGAAAAGAAAGEAADGDEYSDEVQAQQSSSTCKQS